MSTDPPNLTTLFPEIGDQRESHSGIPTEVKRACNSCKWVRVLVSRKEANPCDLRRNKIRCDGGRPCIRSCQVDFLSWTYLLIKLTYMIACLKKGYSPEQCVDGCRNCSRARLPCDGNKPCSSCISSRRQCFDLHDAGALDSPGTVESVSPTIRAGERAKLACQACRRWASRAND